MTRRKPRRIGAFSGRSGPLQIDMRTAQARFYQATVDALVEHVEDAGDGVTAPQRMLIEGCSLVYTRFALLSTKMLRDDGYGSGSTEQWLGLMANVRSTLKELGIKRHRAEKVLPSPTELLELKAND